LDSEQPHLAYCRAAARSVVKRHAITGPPVDVEAIAHAEGFAVDRAPLGELEGRMRKSSLQWTIEVNSGRHVHAQRFTIAHELGHHVMGHDSCGSMDLQERQANVFAAELLIPLAFLRHALTKVRRLGALSQLFFVSKEAMQYKLNEHGLLLKLSGFD
jgi:hypothetical protein